MSDDWLEISSKDIDVREIMQAIRERIAAREGHPRSNEESPEAAAKALWKETIGDSSDESESVGYMSIMLRDCDIVPRYYEIDWRVPILGPLHAIVRRLINAEIRRYLLPSLEKQSRFNRKVRKSLRNLAQENARLNQDLKDLRGTQE